MPHKAFMQQGLVAYPVVGTLAGGVKVVFGVGQFITALFWGVLAVVPTLCGKRGLMEHSWTHIKHGLGNIFAGVLEAIPFVGVVLKWVRDQKGDKFMAYPNLVEQEKAMGTYYNIAIEDGVEDSIGGSGQSPCVGIFAQAGVSDESGDGI